MFKAYQENEVLDTSNSFVIPKEELEYLCQEGSQLELFIVLEEIGYRQWNLRQTASDGNIELNVEDELWLLKCIHTLTELARSLSRFDIIAVEQIEEYENQWFVTKSYGDWYHIWSTWWALQDEKSVDKYYVWCGCHNIYRYELDNLQPVNQDL